MVLIIRRESGLGYYFDSFGVATPPFFLEEYVDLGFNERIQQYDESFCGAYCLYLIYLIDRGLRTKSALFLLVNPVKCPGIYDECLCLGCKDGKAWSKTHRIIDHVSVNQGTCLAGYEQSSFADGNVNDDDNIDQGTCFPDIKDNTKGNINVNDNVNVNDIVNVTNNVNVNDNVNENLNVIDNVNVNDNANVNDNVNVNGNSNDNTGIFFADDNNNDSKNKNDSDNDDDVDKFVYLFGEKNPRLKPIREAVGKPRAKPFSPITYSRWSNRDFVPYTNNISINVNGSLQSWLADDNIIVNAIFPKFSDLYYLVLVSLERHSY